MTETRKPGWAFWTAAALILVFVVYPLSFGPAAWLWVKAGEFENEAVSFAFLAYSMPLHLLCEWTEGSRFKFIGDALARYLEWSMELAEP